MTYPFFVLFKVRPKINKRNYIRLKTFNELRNTEKPVEEQKTFKQVVDALKEGFLSEQDDYKNPETFENVPGINVSLTDLRKKVLIQIGDSKVELSKDEAEQIIAAIEKAVTRMSGSRFGYVD